MSPFLDESLPAGVLDNAETEALWDQCVAIWGTRAHDEWPRFKAQGAGCSMPRSHQGDHDAAV